MKSDFRQPLPLAANKTVDDAGAQVPTLGMAYTIFQDQIIRTTAAPAKKRRKRPAPDGALVDFAGAGELLGLTECQVRGLYAKGELLRVPAVGQKFYFSRAALLKWVERSKIAAGE